MLGILTIENQLLVTVVWESGCYMMHSNYVLVVIVVTGKLVLGIVFMGKQLLVTRIWEDRRKTRYCRCGK